MRDRQGVCAKWMSITAFELPASVTAQREKIESLPELASQLKKRITAVTNAWQLLPPVIA